MAQEMLALPIQRTTGTPFHPAQQSEYTVSACGGSLDGNTEALRSRKHAQRTVPAAQLHSTRAASSVQSLPPGSIEDDCKVRKTEALLFRRQAKRGKTKKTEALSHRPTLEFSSPSAVSVGGRTPLC